MKKLPRKYRFFFQIAGLLLSGFLQAQTPDTTLSPLSARSRQLTTDTLPPIAQDSVATDSSLVDLSKVKLSKEGVDDVVEYGAKDSMWFDVKNKQLHLYGKATVKYTTLNIEAGYILLDYAKNEVSAESFPDSSGAAAGYPKFKSADQEFEANRIRFNFKTKKGIIYEARTKQEDLYILGERSKFVGIPNGDSTKSQQNTIYNENSLLTTCDLPHPHYGIRAKKLKVIPNVMVITGPAHLELGGVPTPLILPFGFFPISKSRQAGLIIPRDFEFARVEGLGVKDFGWYQPISQHMDSKVLFNVYTNGSWGAAGTLRYNRRYYYDGNFYMDYNTRVSEDVYANKVRNKSFGINWSHQQDPKANPTRRFGGTMHIETNRNQNRNRNDYLSVYQNSLSSNLNYSQSFPGKPYTLTAGLSHSQNTQTREMTISFPNVNFTMQRIYPFKRKVDDGTEKWFEKLSLTYSSALQNTVRVPDTLLFTKATLRNARIGIQHKASTDYTFKLFKYINVAPRINYEENWYPYTIRRELVNEDSLVYDTIVQEGTTYTELNTTASRFGKVVTSRNYGFKTFRTFDAGASANTTLFFTRQFKKGWFRGFRHKITPSVSIGVGPDFTQPRYQRYFGSYATDSRAGFGDTVQYSIFDDAIFGKPNYNPRQVAIGYSLGNVLEFKHRVRQDSAGIARPDKKVTLFNNLTFSGNYSLTADTLRWSLVTTGGTFRLFKGITNINWGATFDPYISDAKGRRINKFALQEQHKLVRLTTLSFNFNTGFTISQVRKALEKKSSAATTTTVAAHDDLLGWFDNFRVSHNISFIRTLRPTGYGTTRDTLLVSGNNISLNGSIQLNAKWAIDLNNISYDLVSKRIVYPDLGITRDLHCWQMSISWQPTRGTYFFTINVKPGTLEFLKLPYQKNIYDARL